MEGHALSVDPLERFVDEFVERLAAKVAGDGLVEMPLDTFDQVGLRGFHQRSVQNDAPHFRHAVHNVPRGRNV
jgi:hypothetical protein